MMMRGDAQSLPDYEELTGQRPAQRREQSEDMMAHNARMWIAVLQRRTG